MIDRCVLFTHISCNSFDWLGATKQLSYVRALGADAVILSPVSSRSPDCTKPGVVHFSEVDQRYGDLEAFSALLEKAKKLGKHRLYL